MFLRLPIMEVPRNPVNRSTADTQMIHAGLIFFISCPPVNPPRQKKIMEMVNVMDSCETLQFGNTSVNGTLKMDHA